MLPRFLPAFALLFLAPGLHIKAQEEAQEIGVDFPFASHYIEVLGENMHYIDEGEGDPILFLHGNPTSSYLWRNILPYAVPHGRAIAVDLIGMGKSDKPDIDYSFFDHVRYVEAFIHQMGLENITFVVHDWGSGIGFHYASRHQNNVKAIAFMEAIYRERDSMSPLFEQFRTPGIGEQLLIEQNLFVEQVLPGSVVRGLTEAEMEHYRTPYLEPASRKPVWQWPNQLPYAGEPADVVAAVNAYGQWLENSSLPKLLITADPGALIPAEEANRLQQVMQNLTVVNIGPGRHFIQEDNPHGIGEAVAQWYQGL